VASLSNVESLTEFFPFLATVVENYPWFGQSLAQLAPLILVVFIYLLPQILLAFVGLEKHKCLATLQHPSLFNKVAWLTIIQTFFCQYTVRFDYIGATKNYRKPFICCCITCHCTTFTGQLLYSCRSCTKLPGTWCGTPFLPSALCWKVSWV
jgi:hypothetical protein